MFYLSKSETVNLNQLVLQSRPTVSTQLSVYQLHHPYRLNSITCHPADADNYYNYTTIDPDNTIYTSLSYSEFQEVAPHGLHQHEFYEFVFVVSGTLYQNIENERHLYSEGSCCLLNKNVRHSEEWSTDYRAVYLQLSEPLLLRIYQLFSESYFKEDRPVFPRDLQEFFENNLLLDSNQKNKDYIDFIPLLDRQWQIQHLHNTLETIIKETISPQNGSTLLIHTLLYRLFLILADTKAYSTTPIRIGTSVENQLFDEITEILKSN